MFITFQNTEPPKETNIHLDQEPIPVDNDQDEEITCLGSNITTKPVEKLADKPNESLKTTGSVPSLFDDILPKQEDKKNIEFLTKPVEKLDDNSGSIPSRFDDILPKKEERLGGKLRNLSRKVSIIV